MKALWDTKREFLKRLHRRVYRGGRVAGEVNAVEKHALDNHVKTALLWPGCDGEVLSEACWVLHEAQCVNLDVYGAVLARLAELMESDAETIMPHHVERVVWVSTQKNVGNVGLYSAVVETFLSTTYPASTLNGSTPAVLLEAFSKLSHLETHNARFTFASSYTSQTKQIQARTYKSRFSSSEVEKLCHAYRHAVTPRLVELFLNCPKLESDPTERGSLHMVRVLLALSAVERTLMKNGSTWLSVGIGWGRVGCAVDTALSKRGYSVAVLPHPAAAAALHCSAILPPTSGVHAEVRCSALVLLLKRCLMLYPHFADPGTLLVSAAVCTMRDSNQSKEGQQLRPLYSRLQAGVAKIWLSSGTTHSEEAVFAAVSGLLEGCALLRTRLPSLVETYVLNTVFRFVKAGMTEGNSMGEQCFPAVLALWVYLARNEHLLRWAKGKGRVALADVTALLEGLPMQVYRRFLAVDGAHQSVEGLLRGPLLSALLPLLLSECAGKGMRSLADEVCASARLEQQQVLQRLPSATLSLLLVAVGRLGKGGVMKQIIAIFAKNLTEGVGGWVTMTDISRLWQAAMRVGGVHPVTLGLLDSYTAKQAGYGAFGVSPTSVSSILHSAAVLRAPSAGIAALALSPLSGNVSAFAGMTSLQLSSIVVSLTKLSCAEGAAALLEGALFGVSLSCSEVEEVLRAASYVVDVGVRKRLFSAGGVGAEALQGELRSAAMPVVTSLVSAHSRAMVGVESPVLKALCAALVGKRVRAADAAHLIPTLHGLNAPHTVLSYLTAVSDK